MESVIQAKNVILAKQDVQLFVNESIRQRLAVMVFVESSIAISVLLTVTRRRGVLLTVETVSWIQARNAMQDFLMGKMESVP
ncbi:MAG: hypothetical protein LBO09_00565 [Candidatus Peribacteria bacterium]|jgi:hypothetical protein|nr:hypothetical protein [Candidatus Peribacteria bacterium]